jgi:serine/threonine protein kinase
MIGQTISHYKVTEKLGQGGMGVVYKAKAASYLDHNNICNIYEIDETEDGQMFISMAYYEGETLDKQIKEKPLPVEEAINIAIQIAQGLAKAHEKKVVHRDIKPANIMLTREGVVKVLDFGLAKLTKESTTLGTVSYMSPEQAKGEEVTSKTDIWSLGVILYEMLTGQLPFKGEYDSAVIYSIMNDTQESVTGLRIGIPMELERIINKCLQKNSGDRYQHMEDLNVDLRFLLNLSGSSVDTTEISELSNMSYEKEITPVITKILL